MVGRTRQLAAVGGLVVGVLLALSAVHQLVLYPAAGFRTGGDSADFFNPAKVFGSLWVFQIGDLLNLLLGFALAVFTVGLTDRLRAGAPVLMRLAAGIGFSAATLSFATGVIRFEELYGLAAVYASDPATVGAALLSVNVEHSGLLRATIAAAGVFFGLAGWAGLRPGGLPRPVGYLGLACGVLFLVGFALRPLFQVAPVLGLIWTVWVGVALLREPASSSAARDRQWQ